jgi:predicted permease
MSEKPIRRLFRIPFLRDWWKKEVEDEIQFHLRMKADKLEANGHTPAESRLEALRRFGDVERIRGECRKIQKRRGGKVRRSDFLDGVRQDLAYAIRQIRRGPGYAALVVFTLAAGIASNTIVFSLVNPYFLRELPFREPERLVQLHHVNAQAGWDQDRHSLPMYLDWKERSRAFEDMAAYNYGTANVTGSEGPERIQYGRLTANMFSLLGVDMAMGRGFLSGEDGPGGAAVVVLRHGLWQRRYGGDPDIIGKSIVLNGNPFTVIGVTQPDFNFPFGGVKLWVPLRVDPAQQARGRTSYILVARLRPDWSIERAHAELTEIHRQLSAVYPQDDGMFSGVNVVPMRAALNFVYEIMQMLFVALSCAVGFVLLIACVNVASVTLARASTRSREVAVRAAIGAGRGRIVRQLLTESVVLAVLGGIVGVGVAYWVVGMVGPVIPEDLYRVGDASVDGRVLGFSALLTLATPFLFALTPAVRVARSELAGMLREGDRGAIGSRSGLRSRRILVTAQVALAIFLATGAGLMVRSFQKLMEVDLGFEAERVLTLQVAPPLAEYPEPEDAELYYQETMQRIAALPGVEGVGTVNPLPLDHSTSMVHFEPEGGVALEPEEVRPVVETLVSEGYFQAMGIPVLRGRAFDASDRPEGIRVVMVNQALVDRFWPGGNPVGRRVGVDYGESAYEAIVVGVVGDVRHESLDGEVRPHLYTALTQTPVWSRTIVVRATGEPTELTASVRGSLREVDPNLPIGLVRSMDAVVMENTLQWSITSVALAVFGGVALLLAALGIYGLVSYSVSRRRSEIGVRLALGASRKEVQRLVVRESLRLTGTGAVIGLVLAAVLSRVAASVLFGVSPFDPIAFGGVVLLVVIVAVGAAALPAMRASKVDPRATLTAE